MAITLLMQAVRVQKGDGTMDGSSVGITFEKGEKVRLLRDYPEFKRGKKGTFIQYSGGSVFAIVQFGRVHTSIWPNDLEKVLELSPLFQSGDRVRLTRKYGQHKKGDLATFVQYYSDLGEATVQFDGGIMPFDQVPVAWLQKVKEA